MTDINILYWSRTDFAQTAIVDALQSLPASLLMTVRDLKSVLSKLHHADILVLADCQPEDARQILDCINQPTARLRAVHFITAGRDGFSEAGEFRPSITVTGPDGAIGPTVAEHAVALALAINRQFLPALAAQKKAAWDRSFCHNAVSLEGQTALIIGAGSIGREIAIRLRGFRMHPIAITRTPRPNPVFDHVRPLGDLHALLPTADLIAICIALSSETYHLMGESEFQLCRPTVTLVNVGRGGLIDPAALERALRQRRISGAGIDVTEPEPLPNGHSLWNAPNLLIAGHYSGAGSFLADRRIGASVAKAVGQLHGHDAV